MMPSCGNAIGRDLSEVVALAGRCHHSLQRHQPADGVDIDVRTQPRRTRHSGAADHLEGAQPNVVDGVVALELVHAADRAGQRTVVLGELWLA